MNIIKSILRKRDPEPDQPGNLLITREQGEQVYIGDAVVTVVGMKRGGRVPEVELHIQAPKDVKIIRPEWMGGK